ncbi:MAG: DUF3667 domain-containing protein [Bacteroidota bacterium]
MTPEAPISLSETKHCLNCGEEVHKHFCPACGQKYETTAISLKELGRRRIYKFLKDYRIFFFTVWELVKNPGKVVKEYWAGREMTYYNPFNFFFLIGSLATFVVIRFSTYSDADAIAYWAQTYEQLGIPFDENSMNGMQASLSWARQHYSIVFLIMVPFYALASFWSLRKKGHNLGEHLVMWFYIIGVYSLFTLPTLPFVDMGQPFASPVSMITFPFLFGLVSWFYVKTFNLKWIKAILLSIWVYVFAQLLVVLASIAIGIVFGIGLAIFLLIKKKVLGGG